MPQFFSSSPNNKFQLNTIQRLTETDGYFASAGRAQVPIKHYPTINWNVIFLRTYLAQ